MKVHLNSRIRVESRPYLRGKVCQRRTSTMMKMKPVTMIWMGLMRESYYKVVVDLEIRLERESERAFDEGVEYYVDDDENHHAG